MHIPDHDWHLLKFHWNRLTLPQRKQLRRIIAIQNAKYNLLRLLCLTYIIYRLGTAPAAAFNRLRLTAHWV